MTMFELVGTNNKEILELYELVGTTNKELIEIYELVVNDNKLLFASFTPTDMTLSPGMHRINIGKGTHIYLTGQAADGGGGGDGATGSRAGSTSSGHRLPTRGLGGSGNPGTDGARGGSYRTGTGTFFTGASGGGGEAGENGDNTRVYYILNGRTIEVDLWAGGRGGWGGNGGRGQALSITRGPAGGRGGNNPTVPNTSAQTGSQSSTAGETGQAGSLGDNPGERLYTNIPQDTELIIVIGNKGVGGNGGFRPTGDSSQGATGSQASSGSDGVNDGSIRIRTARGATSATPAASFSLSSFVTTGLTMDVLALITAGSVLYETTEFATKHGTLDDGDVTFSNGSVITRILWNRSNELRINDKPHTPALSDFFNSGGDGNDLTLYLQTSSTLTSVSVVDALSSSGGHFVNFNISGAMATLLSSISEDDKFIIGFGRSS